MVTLKTFLVRFYYSDQATGLTRLHRDDPIFFVFCYLNESYINFANASEVYLFFKG